MSFAKGAKVKPHTECGAQDFDLSNFKEKYTKLYSKVPSDEFLIWLIGFTEGDGCFLITNRNDLMFIISQGVDNKDVLDMIQITLGFGKVIKQGPRVYRYIVQDKKNLELIVSLFNGNIVLLTRQERFYKFLDLYNQKAIKGKIILDPISPIYSNILPSLTNSWLTGFTDSEGCFSVSLRDNIKNGFSIVYLVSTSGQKGYKNVPKLSHLILLFQSGVIQPHSKDDNFSFIASGLKNCENIISSNYFDKFPLKTTKYNSYIKWKEVFSHLKSKDHLDLYLRTSIAEKARLINLSRRKSK